MSSANSCRETSQQGTTRLRAGRLQGRLWHIRHLADYADIAALQDVSPHSFRRTVATEIDEVYDAEAAIHHLGHTSKAVTERHYINRKLVAPDYRAATERLAPGDGTTDGPRLDR